MNDDLFGKVLFIHLSVLLVYHECLCDCMSVYGCASFPFGFESGMWDFIGLVPDHCLSFYFSLLVYRHKKALYL